MGALALMQSHCRLIYSLMCPLPRAQAVMAGSTPRAPPAGPACARSSTTASCTPRPQSAEQLCARWVHLLRAGGWTWGVHSGLPRPLHPGSAPGPLVQPPHAPPARRRVLFGGTRSRPVVHRLALFDVEGALTQIISQSDVIKCARSTRTVQVGPAGAAPPGASPSSPNWPARLPARSQTRPHPGTCTRTWTRWARCPTAPCETLGL